MGVSQIRVTGQAHSQEGAYRLAAKLRGESKSDVPPRKCGGCGATMKPGGRMVYVTNSPVVHEGDIGYITACDNCMTEEQRREFPS